MKEISNKIELLGKDIDRRYHRLDQESIWFFVATLSCWSVSVEWIRLIAIGLVFFFLATQVLRGQQENRSFGRIAQDIKKDILASNFSKDEKNQLIGQLVMMKDNYLPWSKTLRANYRFCAATFFFAVTAVEFIQ